MGKYIIGFICILGICSSVTAEEYQGKVEAFYANRSGEFLVALSDGLSEPDCAGGGLWQFGFMNTGMTSKEWISMLLLARSTGSPIRVGYEPNTTGLCDVIFYFYFAD